MTRWSKDETQFTVRLTPNENGGGATSYVCRVPKPIVEQLGTPEHIMFVVVKNGIKVKVPDTA